MSKRENQGRAAIERVLQLCAPRVGSTPQDRLRWALGHVEVPLSERTPGDIENLRMEIVYFIHARRPVRPVFSGVLVADDKGTVDAPSDREVAQILEVFDGLLKAALHRETVSVATVKLFRFLVWDPSSEEFVARETPKDEETWLLSSRWLLGQDIEKAGHLVKTCPAPAPRREPGDTCGRTFVAKRPNQTYCSATCQTRASTYATRRGEETPVVRERRADRSRNQRKKPGAK